MDLTNLTGKELFALQAEILREKDRRRTVVKTDTIYFHRNKEDNFALQLRHDLTDEQMENFMYTGYEVKCMIEIDNEGFAWATHFAGVALQHKVKI